jgi:hypothetical protein
LSFASQSLVPDICLQDINFERFKYRFLRLPEFEFMNIICGSLPALWGNEQLVGVDGPCPAVTIRANTIAPKVCSLVSTTVQTHGVFLWRELFRSRVPVVPFVFL